MTLQHRRSAHLSHLWTPLLLLLLLVVGVAGPAAGQEEPCIRINNGRLDCATPWAPAPVNLWGELQPADGGSLAERGLARRDITDYNEFTDGAELTVPWFMSVDIENGTVFIAGGYRLQIWSFAPPQTAGDPVGMELLGEVKGSGSSGFPFLFQGEISTPLRDVDAPAGVDSMVAIAGVAGMGLTIVDTSVRSGPVVKYQDSTRDFDEVYAARINNNNYAFVAQTSADTPPTQSGIYVYDMTRAVAGSRCHAPIQTCPGIALGRIGSKSARYVDGAGNFVVSSGGTSRSYEIWSVPDPSSPASAALKLTGLTGQAVYGVALWEDGSSYYLGLATSVGRDYFGHIYDVSCIKTSCSGEPPLLASLPIRQGAPSNWATFSRSGNKKFLHFGTDDTSGFDPFDREFLVEVTNPRQPRILGSPGYWSHTHNFNWVWPGRGKFQDQYFIRAARGIFDVHKLAGNVAPGANFTWSPAEVYPGTAVNFQDASTGQPASWLWAFQDGTPPSAVVASPQGVTFSTVGTKTVQLTATNGAGPDLATKTLQVLDPVPAITGLSVSQATALVCSQLTFSSTGVTGKPTLGYSWEIRDPSGNVVPLPAPSPPNPPTNQPSLAWTSLPAVAPGAYTAKLTVSNQQGMAEKSVGFTLQGLPALAWQQGSPTSPPAPTADPVTAGPVTFHAPAAAGATTWQWDFGDGETLTTSNPTLGMNPTHSYAVAGTMKIKVKVWNCVTGDVGGLTSAELTISVNPVALSAAFQVQCAHSACPVNQAVTFTDSSTGAQLWDYSWDGDDTFEDAGHDAPVATHTFSTPGPVRPKLRVRRGAGEQSVFQHNTILITGSSPPPPPPPPQGITVTGPSAGNVGAALTFNASGSGTCTPASNGWSWSTSGGTITGTATGASIQVSWSAPGPKNVTASNNACGSASGTKTLTINGADNSPLVPNFTFSPPAPKAGDTVAFDGRASTGSPSEYLWDFGDGGIGSGPSATHAFAQNGTYAVKLTVKKAGSGPGCFGNLCFVTATKSVVVGDPAPTAEFTASVPCPNQFGSVQCNADTGVQVDLTATTADATSYQWEFGDGATASGRSVSHIWRQPGSFNVRLTVARGDQTATLLRRFQLTGKSVNYQVLPWIAQTSKSLDQSSDLYVHNPGTAPIEVTLQFRKRGQPEANPPEESLELAPGQTLFSNDVLRELFGRDTDQAGFLTVVVDEGASEPVVTSFNTTFNADGSRFGQTIGGVSSGAASSVVLAGDVQHLVGLNDDGDRSSYFGVSNPNDAPATFRLRFYDKDGHLLATSADFTFSRFGQRQFQIKEIRGLGVEEQGDYRIEVETLAGGPLMPYGANVRSGSDDPSFVGPERKASAKSYLVGALGTPGLNDSLWQSDLVIANVAGKVLATEVFFTRVGLGSAPEDPVSVVLQPGTTERVPDVLMDKWGIDNATGVLTFESEGDAGQFLLVQGESYDNARPERRFGQSMRALTDAEAAVAGQGLYMVGLRQDDNYRTTFWLFNPASEGGSYEIIYRGLDGAVLGKIDAALPPGRARQIRPSDHKIPEAGVENGFTVQIVVKSGKALAAGQVVNNATNDPAYIVGEKR